jgi:RNA polymerase sigma-70 factor (ECF subfamily)
MPEHKKDNGIADTFITCESAIKRFLGRFLYRPEDVDEIAQETFLKAYSAKHRREVQSPKAYLFRVARNIALRELTRKSAKMTDYLEDALVKDESVMGGVDSVEDEIIAQQKISHYCDAVASMPPQCRRVFLLRKVQAKSHKEIAATLNISVSAVEKHIANGVKKFDAFMQSKEDAAQSPAPLNQQNSKGLL